LLQEWSALHSQQDWDIDSSMHCWHKFSARGLLIIINVVVTSGPLPKQLIYFDLMNNSLTGNVPDFSACTELTLVDLSQNKLTGQLPTELSGAGECQKSGGMRLHRLQRQPLYGMHAFSASSNMAATGPHQTAALTLAWGR